MSGRETTSATRSVDRRQGFDRQEAELTNLYHGLCSKLSGWNRHTIQYGGGCPWDHLGSGALLFPSGFAG